MADDEEETQAEEEEYEEVTEEEKLQIVQHLLLSSPPGEFDEVLKDAQVLVGQDLVTPQMLAGICRAHNTQNLRTVPALEEGRRVILCKMGEVSPTHYLDPSTGDVLTVDHVRLEATASGLDPQEATEAESSRVALETALDDYVAKRYAGTAKAAAVFGGTSALTVAISGEHVNLRNFWSGNWRSSWVINLLTEGTATLEGAMTVRAHYFEDGNVQLQTSKASPLQTIAFSDDLNLATQVVDAIAQAETTLQRGLEEMYNNMSSETFKAMRRIMPITRVKMKWNLNELALNRNLRK